MSTEELCFALLKKFLSSQKNMCLMVSPIDSTRVCGFWKTVPLVLHACKLVLIGYPLILVKRSDMQLISGCLTF